MEGMEVKKKIENLIENRMRECKDTFDRYIELNPTDGVRKRTHEILMFEYYAILRDIRNLWIPNEDEIVFVELIEAAKKIVSGELEINYNEEKEAWYARDYKEEFGGSFEIEGIYSTTPMLTKEREKFLDINVQKCCDHCGVYFVG